MSRQAKTDDEKRNDNTQKFLRLKDFDYSNERVYFVTIITENRRKIFYDKKFAKKIIDCLLELRDSMKFNLYSYCLMPDHFHGLIGIGKSNVALGRICGAFKSLTTRIYWNYGDGKLWQRGYHDHIIRNEEDFFDCLKYTKENPTKANLEDWEFVGRVDYLR